MKKYLLWAVAALAAGCSQDDAAPAPAEPVAPQEPVAPRSIVFTCDETELSANGAASVALRVDPADAQIVPTDFRLVDEQTGACPDDFTFYPTGETDPEAGTYGMRLIYKGGERKFRRSFRAVYGSGDDALRSGTLLVSAASYMPVVHVRTEAPVTDKENWIAGTLRIDGGNRFEDFAQTAVSVRGRGNSTWAWEKKPYALKFDKKQSVLGMPKHKRWCLIANYMDRTHLRNRIAYHLGAHSKLDYTTRNEFVELYFNDVYQGCYLLTEQIKVDPNRVDVSETDGFLLEFDTYFDEEVRFRTAASDIPVNVKSPDPEDLTDARLAGLKEYLDRADGAVQALLSGTGGEDPFAFLDRESMIDFWIIFELMANHEMLHRADLGLRFRNPSRSSPDGLDQLPQRKLFGRLDVVGAAQLVERAAAARCVVPRRCQKPLAGVDAVPEERPGVHPPGARIDRRRRGARQPPLARDPYG